MAGESCALHSFAGDTRVLMADGSTKAIAKVKLGDKVVATDPKTGKRYIETVRSLHVNRDTDLVDVTVKDRNGKRATIHTTKHHPFWDAGRHVWVAAADLKVGAQLHASMGPDVRVVGVRAFTRTQTMRDLTIDTVHTYYVLAEDTPILVHNCGGADPGHLKSCECATGGKMRLGGRLGRSRGEPGTVTSRVRPGDETAATAGEVDKQTQDAVEMADNVSTMATTSVPTNSIPTPVDPSASGGGAFVAIALVIWAIRQKIIGE
jgi:hypothetical protein